MSWSIANFAVAARNHQNDEDTQQKQQNYSIDFFKHLRMALTNQNSIETVPDTAKGFPGLTPPPTKS